MISKYPLALAGLGLSAVVLFGQQPAFADIIKSFTNCTTVGNELYDATKKSNEMKCGPRRAQHTKQEWTDFCLKNSSKAKDARNNMLSSLKTCEAKAGNDTGGDKGSNKAKAVASNTVYKKPNGDDTSGNKVCTMRANNTASVVSTGPDNWVHLSKISGLCNGKSGWVWNDGELRLP